MQKNQILFSKVSLFNFIFLLFVICFGAYVRMTGSGAGCGNHWPLCNGSVVPRAPVWQTVIEFSHRLTSGGLLIFCFFLCSAAWKAFPVSSLVRKLSLTYLGLLILEALLGAFLVKYEHVANNPSVYRGISVSLHLINTFLLTLTAGSLCYFGHIKYKGLKPISFIKKFSLLLGGFCIILVGLSGAITALGDTLFPVKSMWEALSRSQSPAEHLFVRLRILHPFLAVFTSVFVMGLCYYLKDLNDSLSEKLSVICLSFFCFQILLGYLNVFFHAPHILQICHLLVALLSWISYCLFCFRVFYRS